MTYKEAIIQSLTDMQKIATYREIYEHMKANNYYDFSKGKTPAQTVSALLGSFIREGDTRVKRIAGEGGTYSYYLSKDEAILDIDAINAATPEKTKTSKKKTYHERDLHKLLSSYLKNTSIYSRTIFHEKSKTKEDSNQNWVHPDMVGIRFQNLQNKVSQTLLKAVNKADTFKISSYELKKEIKNDADLKRYYFQAVSNSSWANYGYLVAFDISNSLNEEMERLNQSFGIGIIQLDANPFFSKVLYHAKYRELDFKTIDKLCKINSDFEGFIGKMQKLLNAPEGYEAAMEKELVEFCDDYFGVNEDGEVVAYCKAQLILAG